MKLRRELQHDALGITAQVDLLLPVGVVSPGTQWEPDGRPTRVHVLDRARGAIRRSLLRVGRCDQVAREIGQDAVGEGREIGTPIIIGIQARQYMRDGFAARFVLELFREFTVLFIGYSINDPVMRYLVDIFATEQRNQRKGQFNEAFAIASFRAGREASVRAVWQAKNVTPILYDDTDHHRRLTELMTAWAGLYTAGAGGRFSKFLEITRQPYSADPEDNAVRTAAWALADERGRTAERLASLTSERAAETNEDNANATPDLPDDAHISWLGPLLQAEVLDPRDHRYPRETCKLSDVPDVARHLCRWAVRHLETRELVE